MHPYRDILRPLLFRLDAEEAHDLAQTVLRATGPVWALGRPLFAPHFPELATTLFGRELGNPLGLAAGFDKNGLLAEAVAHLGFGYVEVGSVTARPSPGNTKPRLFRLVEDRALINRMGLNGDGADVVASRLARLRATVPLAVNIARTNDPCVVGDAAISDVLYTFERLAALPVLYMAFNASCPNTHDGAIREASEIADILAELKRRNERSIPILLKLSPDSSDDFLERVVGDAIACGVAGFVCGNTTATRPPLRTPSHLVEACGAGGLSGEPLRPLAEKLVARVARLRQKEQVVIAAGGVSSGRQAYNLVLAGAAAFQVYTALVYEGPGLPGQVLKELALLLRADGLTMRAAVGAGLP